MRYPTVDRAFRYVEDVLGGKIAAGKLEIAACKRHRSDMQRADEGWIYRFDPIRAERACRFIETLRHIKGELAARKETIRLEGWQCFVIGSLFGWVHVDTGLRRFRIAYFEIARKNAKSTLMSGVALYCLALDGEAGAEVYSAATTKEQARKIFDPARSMALAHPELRSTVGMDVKKHAIEHPRSNSVFLPRASQTDSLDGDNPSCALIDELHAHPTRSTLDVLRSGMGSRRQPLEISITTAGDNIAGVCYEERAYAEKVLQGIITDEARFSVIFTIDEEDDPFDPTVWRKANPNLGVSVEVTTLEQQARIAKATPTMKGEFLRKHCCVWSVAGVGAFDLDRFRDRVETGMQLHDFANLDDLRIGIDGSKNDDFTSIVVMGWDGPELLIWDEHFVTEDILTAEGNEHLAAWHDSEWLHRCEGALIDMTEVEDRVFEIAEAVRPAEISYDPMYLAQLAVNLSKRVDQFGCTLVEQRQNTMSLDPPLRMAQGLIRDRRIVSRGNPVMNWMVANARAKAAGEFLKLFKIAPASKIDGVQALLTGMARMEQPVEETEIFVPDGYRISA